MSFDEYFYAEAAMSFAAQEWEFFTDVDFIHKPAYDTQCNNTNLNVMFNVRKNNNWGQEARAFFPGDSRLLREVVIGSGFLDFNLATFPVSLYGVMRHELGHVLGLRHEHIRADFPGGPKCTESNNYQILTPPDFYSVMNYAPCVGQQWFELSLSAWDIDGIKQLYDDVQAPPNQGAQPPAATDLRWLPTVINFILLD